MLVSAASASATRLFFCSCVLGAVEQPTRNKAVKAIDPMAVRICLVSKKKGDDPGATRRNGPVAPLVRSASYKRKEAPYTTAETAFPVSSHSTHTEACGTNPPVIAGGGSPEHPQNPLGHR